jgi:hypothetical protein
MGKERRSDEKDLGKKWRLTALVKLRRSSMLEFYRHGPQF